MSAGEAPRFTLEEIADSSGLSKRTIRYYIAEGALSPALGRSRSAYYTPAHLEELEQVKRLRENGLSIAEIRGRRTVPPPAGQAGTVWERIALHPALELHIRPDAPAYVRLLAERFLQEAEDFLGDDGIGETNPATPYNSVED